MTNSRKTFNNKYTPIRRWILRMRRFNNISTFTLQVTVSKDKMVFCKKENTNYYEKVNYKSRGSLSKIRKIYWTDFWTYYQGVKFNYLEQYDKR